MKTSTFLLWCVGLLLAALTGLTAEAADFTYVIADGKVTITQPVSIFAAPGARPIATCGGHGGRGGRGGRSGQCGK